MVYPAVLFQQGHWRIHSLKTGSFSDIFSEYRLPMLMHRMRPTFFIFQAITIRAPVKTINRLRLLITKKYRFFRARMFTFCTPCRFSIFKLLNKLRFVHFDIGYNFRRDFLFAIKSIPNIPKRFCHLSSDRHPGIIIPYWRALLACRKLSF